MSDIVTQSVLIKTLDPVITTDQPVTLGTADALPYIPGAMLQGLLVSRAYREKWEAEEVFELFHSGRLIVGDGLPVGEDGSVGFPVPMSFYRPKEKSVPPGGSILELAEDRAADCEFTPGRAQCRGFAVSTTGHEIPVRTGTTLRTAINPNTQTAAEKQLFEYRYLEPGQCFVARLTLPKDDLDKINGLLGTGGILGRSKGAEFGRVRFEWLGDAWSMPGGTATGPGERFVWCLSDLWLDEIDLSSQNPLGRSEYGTVDWQHSFVRRRRFSAYNDKWQCRTPEHIVILRGSVLKLEGACIEPKLHTLGLGTEQGMGLVLIGATSPLKTLRAFDSPVSITLPDEESGDDPVEATALVAWLLRKANDAQGKSYPPGAKELREIYSQARRYNGRPCGPGLSQWGRLQHAARRNDLDAARAVLWQQDSDGPVADSDWNVSYSLPEPKPPDGAEGAADSDRNVSRSTLPRTLLGWMIAHFPCLSQKNEPAAGEMQRLAVMATNVRRAMQAEDWRNRRTEPDGEDT